MNIYATDLKTRFQEGRVVRVMAMGDSLTSGTGGTSGWRGPLKRIMSAWGYSNWEYVGSQTSNPDELGEYVRDWRHEGYGGITVAQLTSTVRARVATFRPDLIILVAGTNSPPGQDRAGARADFNAWFNEAFADQTLRVLSVSRPPQKSSENWLVDGVMEPVVQGHKDAVRDQQNLGRAVVYAGSHDLLRVGWSPLWYQPSDNTHFNRIGYARLAGVMARALVGGPSGAMAGTLTERPVGSTLLSSVATDQDFPFGATLKKSVTSDAVRVLTWRGETVDIPTTWPAHTPWPVPIVRVMSTGTTLTGPLILSTFAPGVLI